jgi:hypothetical protein
MHSPKLSVDEKAVLRKVQDGKTLGVGDKSIIQAKARALQRRHLNGRPGSTGSGDAASTQIMPTAINLVRALTGTARGMYNMTPPSFGGQIRALETGMRSLQQGGGNASFDFSQDAGGAVPITFHCYGSFSVSNLTMIGEGPAGSSGMTAQGSGTTTTTGSTTTVGVGGGGGMSSSAGGSMSGVTVGTGSGGGASGGINNTSSTSTTTGSSGSGSTAVSGTVMRETYSGTITCSYNIDATYSADWYNPLSWIGAGAGAAMGENKSAEGTCADCGTVEMDVNHAS